MNRIERAKKLREQAERLEQEEFIEKEKKEIAEAISSGLFKPLKRAKLKKDLWYISEYTFEEVSSDWYTAQEILGEPQFKKDDSLVLIQTNNENSYLVWVKESKDIDDYVNWSEDYTMEDSDINRKYLKETEDIKA